MSLYHERGGNSHNFNSAPQIVRLPISPLPPMRVDQIRTEPYLLKKNPKSKPPSLDTPSSVEKHLKNLTTGQKQALYTALFITSIGFGLAADSNIAHASTPAEINQTNCGKDWFDPSQTCMCDYIKGDPPMTVRLPGDGCGDQKTKNTVPDPKSEVHTGLDREIPGSTLFICSSGFVIIVGACLLAISRDLNKDMPN